MCVGFVKQPFGPFTIHCTVESEEDNELIKVLPNLMVNELGLELCQAAFTTPGLTNTTDDALIALKYIEVVKDYATQMVTAQATAETVLSELAKLESLSLNGIPNIGVKVSLKIEIDIYSIGSIAVGTTVESRLPTALSERKVLYKNLLHIFDLVISNRMKSLADKLQQRNTKVEPANRGLVMDAILDDIQFYASISFARRLIREVEEWI